MTNQPRGVTRVRILEIIAQDPKISVARIAAHFQMRLKTAEHHFARMRRDGLIRHIGTSAGGYYEILTPPPEQAAQLAAARKLAARLA